MKCKVCGREAVIKLKAYNTSLCADDFISFFEKRVEETIRKYSLLKNGRPIVAVSGGKDSLTLWYILNKLGVAADGIYVNLGIGEYSLNSLEKVKKMAQRLNRKVYIFDVCEIVGKNIEGIARIMKRVPCSACGMVKRYVMNRVCLDMGYDVVLTGHNLDDEASALFGNLLYWREGYLWKKDLTLEEKDGRLSRKAKPLFLCSERETAAYAIVSRIDYIYEECPLSFDAKSLVYKEVLNRIEEISPGTKIAFVKGYLKMLKKRKAFEEEGDGKGMGVCEVCGYPARGLRCAMCRLMEKSDTSKQIAFIEYNPEEA
ncbi:MAG: adenine nucleotide alpha hydrolase family protein [Syntrophorhabdaceae bacterium]|nr:adenine nucleotide alpha hydrolase family protein [Syntrophorhabdaceae bacterium]